MISELMRMLGRYHFYGLWMACALLALVDCWLAQGRALCDRVPGVLVTIVIHDDRCTLGE